MTHKQILTQTVLLDIQLEHLNQLLIHTTINIRSVNNSFQASFKSSCKHCCTILMISNRCGSTWIPNPPGSGPCWQLLWALVAVPGASSVNPVPGTESPKPGPARTPGFCSALAGHYGPKHTGPSCLQGQPEQGKREGFKDAGKRCGEETLEGTAREQLSLLTSRTRGNIWGITGPTASPEQLGGWWKN